ncbi:MAG: helix-turn-helix transcriptional regulator [Candidatus Kapabacteria bacterium]|nr:helix-turn-helix transcriptional regulator [Candidatus Kapabacteria bacterium]
MPNRTQAHPPPNFPNTLLNSQNVENFQGHFLSLTQETLLPLDKHCPWRMSKYKMTTFGEQVRLFREEAKLSLREVAEQIDIDTSLLGKIERNERQPTKEQIKLVAKFFNLDEKDLMKEFLSDQIAYKIMEEEADIDTLKVAEKKIQYLKMKK